MTLNKPKSIAENEFKSQKWDELTQGRKFSQSDIPALELLCSWHAIAQKCMSDLYDFFPLKHTIFYDFVTLFGKFSN